MGGRVLAIGVGAHPERKVKQETPGAARLGAVGGYTAPIITEETAPAR